MTTGNALLALASAVGFVQMVVLTALYALRSHWRSSAAGIVLLSSFAIKAVIFGMILLGRLTGPLGIWVWVVAVGAFDAVQFAWLWLVIREQRDRRSGQPDEPSL